MTMIEPDTRSSGQNDQHRKVDHHPNRRTFLGKGLVGWAAVSSGPVLASAAYANDPQPRLRLGLVTDLHYADKPPAGTRHYRDTLDKMAASAVELKSNPIDGLIELGDFIDSAPDLDQEFGHLRRIQQAFANIHPRRLHVLGNHCVHTLTKPEFLMMVGQDRSYGSCEWNGYHIVYLDACFREDGVPYGRQNFDWTDPNVSSRELKWLQRDLRQYANEPTLVFVHQRLDVGAPYGIKNAAAIRELLEGHGRVLAVFQGHSHHNELRLLNHIPYITLAAVVEGQGTSHAAHAVLSCYDDGSLRIDGFGQQASYRGQPLKKLG